MERFVYAHAAGAESQALLDDCLRQLGELPAAANLGFVYAHDSLAADMDALLARLRAATPGIHWVGTVGRGICASQHEYFDVPALAMMVGAFDQDSFRVFPFSDDVNAALPGVLKEWCEQQGYCFGMLHGDPNQSQLPALVAAIDSALPAGFINGGVTSSNTSHFQVADGGIVSGGVSGVLFGPQVTVATDHTQGCTPIGSLHEITEVSRNIAVRLDGRPAFDVMKEDMGEVLARDLQRVAGYILVALPITGSDTGDYLVRNLLGIDTKNGLLAVGDYLDGHQSIMFCRRDGNSAREDMRRMLERLKGRIGDQVIRGGIYVSCVGRGPSQFADGEELSLIHEALGDFPMVGFYAGGELYNGRLYSYTGVLTLFL